MNNRNLGKTPLSTPVISVGCMHIGHELESRENVNSFINGCLDLGINFFDLADIYEKGESEALFGSAMSGSIPRERVLLQSKCGIVRDDVTTAYSADRDYVLKAVEGSLRRLQTDYLDVLLIHRPDPLCDYEELAGTLSLLEQQGKVRYFGVSNFTPYQIKLLQKYWPGTICANQLQYSPTHSFMVSAPLHTNTTSEFALMRDDSVLDFCRLEEITIQAWSPFQAKQIRGTFIDSDKFQELNAALLKVADKDGVTKTAIVISWIRRHPAQIQPVVGSTKISRLTECVKGAGITISREDWFEIYLAAGNKLQ
jgi:predicted oxidoreductase